MPSEVEHHRERGDALPNRLARFASIVQSSDERRDVCGDDGVDTTIAKHRQHATECRPVLHGGAVSHVDTRLLPASRNFTQGWRDRRLFEGADVRHTHRRKFPGNPVAPRPSLAHRPERAAVAGPTLATPVR